MLIDHRSHGHHYRGLSLPAWDHQATVYRRTWNLNFFAIFAEPRTGKTRIILDSAARLFHDASLRTLVVIAPNGVHRNWVTDEIPRWLSPRTEYKALLWRSSRAKSKKFQHAVDVLYHNDGLSVLSANIDAATNDAFRAIVRRLAERGKMMGVSDESADLAHTTSQRQKAMVKLRTWFAWRRILDGTPVDESPLDAYGQVQFLNDAPFGFTSFMAFKRRYAIIQKTAQPGSPMLPHAACKGAGCADCGYVGDVPGRSYEVVVGYKNLPEYRTKLSRFAAVIRRTELKDLPPRTVTRRYYQLSDEQRRVYNDLADRFTADLADGRTVTAAMVLTRYLRLQQVCHNFFPETREPTTCDACQGDGCDACQGLGFIVQVKPLSPIDPARHPRLDALLAELKTFGDAQVTIWTTFHQDADTIVRVLNDRKGGWASRYDGTVPEAARAEAKTAYQTGHSQYLVGTPAAGGRGLDFSNAPGMIFYGHTYRRRLRSQAEDRGESMNRQRGLAIVDLVAEDSVDEDILNALKEKKDLAAFVLGSSNWRHLFRRKE